MVVVVDPAVGDQARHVELPALGDVTDRERLIDLAGADPATRAAHVAAVFRHFGMCFVDLVVANREENRERNVVQLREAGIPVWVTDIRTLPGAFDSLRRLLGALAPGASPAWLSEAESVWSGPAPAERIRVAVPIWRDPWMFVGADTFAHDLLARLGARNVFADLPGRYPGAGPDEAAGADLVLLPDEPYAFGPDDGPEAFDPPSVLVRGRDLTWYGPSLIQARHRLSRALVGPSGPSLRDS